MRDATHPGWRNARGGLAPDDGDRLVLQKAAKAAGVFAPHVGIEFGGHGLDMCSRFSFRGGGVLAARPARAELRGAQRGNMHLLEVVATAEQKERYLPPLAAGGDAVLFRDDRARARGRRARAILSTTATKDGGGWRIDGRKWFISGAHGAGFAICMARTSGAPGERGGATMFLVDADKPGMRIVRDIETLDEGLFGGHSEECVFDGCVVGPESVLGEVDRGFSTPRSTSARPG